MFGTKQILFEKFHVKMKFNLIDQIYSQSKINRDFVIKVTSIFIKLFYKVNCLFNKNKMNILANASETVKMTLIS